MPQIRSISASVQKKSPENQYCGLTDGRTDRQTECKPKLPFGFPGRGLIITLHNSKHILSFFFCFPDRADKCVCTNSEVKYFGQTIGCVFLICAMQTKMLTHCELTKKYSWNIENRTCIKISL